MNDPVNPLGREVWQRGARLGLWWTLICFGAALLVYAVLGLLGWAGVARALCAMAIAPAAATSLIAAWWVARRPALAASAAPPDQPEARQIDD